MTASAAPDSRRALLDKAEQKREFRKRSRRRAWLNKHLDVLSPVDAYLLKRTYVDEEDLETLAKLQGVERGVLSRRLAVTVKRLIKARRAKLAMPTEKGEEDHGEN